MLRYPFSRRQFARVHGGVASKEDGRPLRGHKVVLVDPAPVNPGQRFLMETKTDREGKYRFSWVPPGNYALVAPGTLGRMDAGLVLNGVPEGADLKMDIEVARRPAGGARATAVVKCVDEAGAALPEVEVSIMAKNFHLLPLLTGADGVATQGDIPAALFSAVGRKQGFQDAAGPFNAPGAPSNEVRLVLRRLVTVRVVAVDDTTGQPLRRARIAIDHAGGMAENIEEILRPPAVITADGGFDLQVLPGPAKVLSSYPGYEMGDVEVDVPLAGVQTLFTVRMREKLRQV